MKHYIGTIEERNGDMGYSDKFLFATKGNPDKHMDKVAKEWRGCTKQDWDEHQGAYWSDSTLVWAAGYREIPEDDYVVLSKYLAVL